MGWDSRRGILLRPRPVCAGSWPPRRRYILNRRGWTREGLDQQPDEGLFYSTPEGAVQRIPWARFGHKHAAEALLPDRLHGGLWLGFLEGGIAYLKDGQIRASYNVADGLGNGAVTDLQLWFGRCCLGRDRGWFKPSERRPHHDSYQQERPALRCR